MTVSLAETPARVQVPSARPQPASARSKPAAAPQGKTLFGLPAVLTPPTQAAAATGASAVSKPAASASLPAVAPRLSTPAGVQDKAKGKVPAEGAFAANTPAAKSPSSSQASVSPALEAERTQDISLSDTSLVEPRGSLDASAAPKSEAADVPSVVVSADASLPVREESRDEAPAISPPRNVPSTEPAPPRPRSALKYGLWAAVPVTLCAAWFAWHSPLVDTVTPQATEVALKSEQKIEGPEPSPLPALAAPAAAEQPTVPAPEVVPEATGAVPAVDAPDAPEVAAPTEDAVSPSAMAPAAEPDAPAAPAEAAAELDPDAEDADVELDASRKVVAARAEKLVSEGHALRKKKKLAPARAKYRDALVIYPGYPRAIAGLVQVSIQQRDGKAAVNLAKQLVKLRPAQVSYQVLLGDAYKVAGKPGLAKEAWQAAARKGSGTAKARLGE